MTTASEISPEDNNCGDKQRADKIECDISEVDFCSVDVSSYSKNGDTQKAPSVSIFNKAAAIFKPTEMSLKNSLMTAQPFFKPSNDVKVEAIAKKESGGNATLS